MERTGEQNIEEIKGTSVIEIEGVVIRIRLAPKKKGRNTVMANYGNNPEIALFVRIRDLSRAMRNAWRNSEGGDNGKFPPERRRGWTSPKAKTV